MHCVLIVAGLDPSGGAGLVADCLAVRARGLHPAAIATALTVQDSARCHAAEPIDPSLLERQLAALADDLPIRAVKIGMLGTAAVARALCRGLEPLVAAGVPIVVDPVLRASVGADLLEGDPVEAYAELLGLATLLTPNRDEARVLSGSAQEAKEAASSDVYRRRCARTLRALGPRAVLLKGGHFPGDPVLDLFDDGGEPLWLSAARQPAPLPHGTGCALSTDVACLLASGLALREAVTQAHERLQQRIAAAAAIGRGRPFLGTPA